MSHHLMPNDPLLGRLVVPSERDRDRDCQHCGKPFGTADSVHEPWSDSDDQSQRPPAGTAGFGPICDADLRG